MYRGFNFKPSKENSILNKSFAVGERIYEDCWKLTKPTLDKYISSDGSIDGCKMQEDWFPQNLIKSDVFISHSHKDKNISIGLAGWLFENFKLKSFIDSCIWSHGDMLLKKIDDRFCKSNVNKDNYIYDNRNFSTSHVHMMLSNALSKMMDKVECMFFINTINSITPKGLIEQTESPWIYFEITLSQIIQKPFTGREILISDELTKAFSTRALLEAKMPSIKYDVGSHLKEINELLLNKWALLSSRDFDNRHHALDLLYNLIPK